MEKIKKLIKSIYIQAPQHVRSEVKKLAEILNLPLEEPKVNIIRIAHIADIHITEKRTIAGMHFIDEQTGKSKKLIDIERCFLYAVNQAIENKCKLALITEPFDRPNPTPNEITVFTKGIELLSKHMPVIIEPGNHGLHKNKKHESVFTVFKNMPNVYVAETPQTFFFDGETIYTEYTKKQKGVFIHVLPYPLAYVESNDKNEIKKVMLNYLEQFKMFDEPCILLAHLTLDCALDKKIIAKMNEPVFSVKDLAGFSYVALGHIHKFMPVSERIYYAGNIERLNFDEEQEDKGFIIADLNIETKELKVHFIKTPATEFINIAVDEFMKLKQEDINKNAVYRVLGEIEPEQKQNYSLHLMELSKINPFIMSKVKIKRKEVDRKKLALEFKKIDDEEVLKAFLSEVVKEKQVDKNLVIELALKEHRKIQESLKRH